MRTILLDIWRGKRKPQLASFWIWYDELKLAQLQMKIARHWEPMLVVSSDSETESWWKNVPVLCNVHHRWKTDLQTKWSWRGEWHWRVPCQTCGSPTHQCPHSGTFRLLSGLPIFHQLPDSHMTFPKILLFRSTYWSAPRVINWNKKFTQKKTMKVSVRNMLLVPYLGATNKLLKTGHIVPVTLLAFIHIF